MKMNRGERSLLTTLSSASATPSDAFKRDLAAKLGIQAAKPRFEWLSLMAGAAFASVALVVVVAGFAAFDAPASERDLAVLQQQSAVGDDLKQATMATGAAEALTLPSEASSQTSNSDMATTSVLTMDGRTSAPEAASGLGLTVNDDMGALYQITTVDPVASPDSTTSINRNGQTYTAYFVYGHSGTVDVTGQTPSNMLAYEADGTWYAIFNYGRLTTDQMKQHLESDDY